MSGTSGLLAIANIFSCGKKKISCAWGYDQDGYIPIIVALIFRVAVLFNLYNLLDYSHVLFFFPYIFGPKLMY